MTWLVPAGWVALGLVHLLPAMALVRPQLLGKLYGLSPEGPLFLLMQHRAALFAGLVIVCLWCAVDRQPRQLAVVLLGFSMLSFLWLWQQAGQPADLRRIALVDLAGLAPLLLVGWAAFRRG